MKRYFCIETIVDEEQADVVRTFLESIKDTWNAHGGVKGWHVHEAVEDVS